MHIYCIFLICIFVQISCLCGSAYFVHISAYFHLHKMAYLPLCNNMHIQVYFSIFTLIMPVKAWKANQFNKYSNCCWRTTPVLLQISSFASCTSWICRITLSPLRIWFPLPGAAMLYNSCITLYITGQGLCMSC